MQTFFRLLTGKHQAKQITCQGLASSSSTLFFAAWQNISFPFGGMLDIGKRKLGTENANGRKIGRKIIVTL